MFDSLFWRWLEGNDARYGYQAFPWLSATMGYTTGLFTHLDKLMLFRPRRRTCAVLCCAVVIEFGGHPGLGFSLWISPPFTLVTFSQTSSMVIMAVQETSHWVSRSRGENHVPTAIPLYTSGTYTLSLPQSTTLFPDEQSPSSQLAFRPACATEQTEPRAYYLLFKPKKSSGPIKHLPYVSLHSPRQSYRKSTLFFQRLRSHS